MMTDGTRPDGTLDDVVLARHLAGEGDADDARQVEAWASASDAHRTLLERMRAAWQVPSIPAPSFEVATLLRRAREVRARPSLIGGIAGRRSVRVERGILPRDAFSWQMLFRSQSRRWGQVIGLMTFGLIAVWVGAFTSRRGSPQARWKVGQRYTALVGERMTVHLPDGSRVILAPQTTLTIPKDFGVAARTMVLSGRAYFDVVRSAVPFVVRTGTITTRVLGTSFAIQWDAVHHSAEIAVVTGKVVSWGHGVPITVVAGRIAQITDSAGTVTSGRGLDAYTSWIHGQLVFDDTPVTTMLTTVGRWYGYEFRLADSTLATQYVSTVFSTSDARDMIRKLAALLDVTMQVDGHVITLIPRRGRYPSAHATKRNAMDTFSPSLEIGR